LRVAAALSVVAAAVPAAAQARLEPFSPPAGRVLVSERSDFSRYEDGRYVGHVYREARLDLSVSGAVGGRAEYDGEALVLEETMRDERAVARRLDAAVPVSFSVEPGGAVRFRTDEGYPILRGVPDPPPEPADPGDRWTGEGVVVVRPRPGRPATRIPVLVEYEYTGATKYGETPASTIRARYAIRYKGGDRIGDLAMTGSSGSRTADIVVDSRDGSTLFVRETVDETFSYSDGSTVRLKGFILHFHKGSLPADRERIASMLAAAPGTPGGSGEASEMVGGQSAVPSSPATATRPADASVGPTAGADGDVAGDAVGDAAGGKSPATAPPLVATGPVPGGAFEIAEGERGVVLLLFDLRFVADGDQLLASERGRLDAIAEALGRIPGGTFLVEGHAADLGRPAGQYELSERRAKRIVDEMTARGIPANRFVYRGLGADKPIAPNDTEQNRARNRRVEITVLD
jgi:outer membrane protein OmpA-like peptidoglycan-associated protein